MITCVEIEMRDGVWVVSWVDAAGVPHELKYTSWVTADRFYRPLKANEGK